jgi:hypothetical protein
MKYLYLMLKFRNATSGSYSFEGNKLKLNVSGGGWIELKLYY